MFVWAQTNPGEFAPGAVHAGRCYEELALIRKVRQGKVTLP